MSFARPARITILLWALVVIAVPVSRADPSGSGDGLELIQSELDHLQGRDVTTALRFVDAQPKHVFETIGRAAGFRVQFDGEFPSTARVTVDRGTTTVRALLEELERELQIVYRVPSPNRLVIVLPRLN